MFILLLLILFSVVVIISNITNTDPWDYFDPKRWRSFSVWLTKLYLHKQGETDKYLTRVELIQYGYRFAKCYECIIKGKCVHCGCDAEGRFNTTTDYCSANKFGEFMSEEEVDSYFLDPKSKFSIKVKE